MIMNFNPIFKRDLTVGSRSTKLSALIVAMNAVLLGADILGMFGRFARFRIEKYMDLRSMLTVYCLAAGVIFLYILFLYPALTLGSIGAERENGTMDLMLASGLSPRRIVSGKFFAQLLPGLVLLVTFLPGLALPLLFGGVTMTSCILLLIAFIPMVLEMLCIGLFSGACTRSGGTAAFVTYATVIGITLAPFAIAVLFRGLSSGDENYISVLTVLSPVTPAAQLLAEQVGETALFEAVYRWLKFPAGLLKGNTPAVAGIVFQMIAAAVFFVLAVAKTAPGKRRSRLKRAVKQLQSEEKCVE